MEHLEEHDLRTLIPIQRHEWLNKTFKELKAGDSFVFINDHDPKPVYYEFRSIYGDVVAWEYLNKGGREWKVKVTRTEESKGREFEGASTLMDLRKAEKKDWNYAVFHRYGMMKVGDTMELISEGHPNEIKHIFEKQFNGKYEWTYKKQDPFEVIAHIKKVEEGEPAEVNVPVVDNIDLRPFAPAKRHEMFFEAFDTLKPGESFLFINDHDPKPLYYQLEAESSEPFKWEYLESGPEEWKLKVSKVLE